MLNSNSQTATLDEGHTIRPAVEGTVGILKSALKVSSIKRIIITSTVGVVMGDREDTIYNGKPPCILLPLPPRRPSLTHLETTTQPTLQGPFTESGPAYLASKRFAYRATTEFITQHTPTFAIVNLMPTFILGSWELATSFTLASGSNGFALTNVLGRDFPVPLYGTTVHVQDLARVHVEAMTNEKIKGHEDFILNSDGTEGAVWADAITIAKKYFPEAVGKGILPLGGVTETAKRMIDSSKVERVFGIKLMGFEEQMVGLIGQYVELVEKEQGKKV